jgi:hypothetical protein
VTTETISLYTLLQSEGSVTESISSKDKPDFVRSRVKEALARSQDLEIDLSKLRNLSPSFAYEAFGKLVDDFGAEVKNRFKFINDDIGLSQRILDAIERRNRVVSAI